MSIVQVLRIIWAWRWFTAITTVSCLLGAFVVTSILPPRWQADARVVLNLLKPDPVSGEVTSGNATNAYINSQVNLITDYSVASRAVDELGWLSDPNLIARYSKRPASDTRDFRHWAAQIIISGTQASVLLGSNILDITYTGPSAENAKAVAEALRKAYIDTNISLRRASAGQSADSLDTEVIKAKVALDAAETAKYKFEKENNVYMTDDKTDVDTAKLAALAATADSSGAGGSAPNVQLADIDSQIARMSQTLGPNHPDLVALRAKRASIASAIARSAGTSSSQKHSGSAVDAQAAVVLSKSDKLIRLKQLQAELEVRREMYNSTVEQAAKQRQQSAIGGDTGLFSPLGPATVPAAPSFPNMMLIIPGSLGLGLALGLFLSLLIELVNRRVRGPEDLVGVLNAPMLAVVSSTPHS